MPAALLLPLLASLWLPPACGAGSCDCMPNGTVAESREAAEAVFVGSVASIRDTIVVFQEYRHGMRAVTIQVQRAWKGVGSEFITLVTGWGAGDCGFPFEIGKTYLVYADRRSGTRGEPPLATSICSRTVDEARGVADIRELGPPAHRWPVPAPESR